MVEDVPDHLLPMVAAGIDRLVEMVAAIIDEEQHRRPSTSTSRRDLTVRDLA